MSQFYNPFTKQFEDAADTAVTSKTLTKSQNRLNQYGYDSEIKPKQSTLETLLDLLSRPEAASASFVGGLNTGQGLGESLRQAGEALTGKRKYSYTQLLKDSGMGDNFGTKALGFVLGTVLDPTTYIPVGKVAELAGKGAKMVLPEAAKVGLEALAKKGKGALGIADVAEHLKPAYKEAKTLAGGVSPRIAYETQKNLDKYAPLFDLVGSADEKVLKRVGVALEKDSPKYLSPAAKEVYAKIKTMFKETGEQKQAINVVKDLIGAETTKAGQMGLDLGTVGVRSGLTKATVDEAKGYLPHMITDDFRALLKSQGGTTADAMETLRGLARTNLPKAEKERALLGQIKDLNKLSRNKFGIDMFETDLKKVIPKYIESYSRNLALTDWNKELMALTDTAGKAVIKPITGEVAQGMVKLTGLPYKEGFQTTPEFARVINRTTGILSSDAQLNSFVKGYDKVMNLWKKGVTSLSPSFHTGNMVGASFNNFVKDSGSFAPDVLNTTKRILRNQEVEIAAKNGQKISGAEFLDYLKKHGALTSFTSAEEAVKKGKGVLSKANDVVNTIGSGVENIARTQLAVSQFKKTGNLSDAVRAVWEVHGNYAPEAMSTAERTVIKRLFPFYNWAKTNIPFQLKNLATNTGKYTTLARIENTMVTPEERAKLPEYMRGQILGPLSKNGDNVSARAIKLPVGDLNDISVDPNRGVVGNTMETLRRMLGGKLAPLPKAVVELASNKNLFFNRPIVDENLPGSMQKTNAPSGFAYLPQTAKDLIGYQEVTKKNDASGLTRVQPEMNAKLKYLIDTFLGPVSKYANMPKNVDAEAQASGINRANMNVIMEALAAINSSANPAKVYNYNAVEQRAQDIKSREVELQNRINYLISKGLIPKLR